MFRGNRKKVNNIFSVHKTSIVTVNNVACLFLYVTSTTQLLLMILQLIFVQRHINLYYIAFIIVKENIQNEE